jgi:signal transduction histidine kinase
MRRDSLLRSTPFRLALVFGTLFVSAFLLAGFVAFHLTGKELDAKYDGRVREMFRVIADTYVGNDVEDLVNSTKVHIAATSKEQSVFLLKGPRGGVLAGNIPTQKVPDGWSRRTSRALGIKGHYTYRMFAGDVGPNRLIVGTSNEETTELEEIVLASFGWASIVVVCLAIGGGALVASRAQRRLDAVRDTMSRVSHGELTARLPFLGKGDDIDLLSRDINEALERLSTTVEGMRQVSTDIAHDLKTPLNRLKMTLDEALLREENGQSAARELEAASIEADRINQTFDALLRIAQIEAGARRARFVECDVTGVLRSLSDVYHDVAEDMGQSLVADLDPTARRPVSGDPELLTQMYANLIENAIRHCPAGSKIRLALFAENETITTVVEDDGPGIPESEHEKVFRRLYRLDKSRSSSGTGLGLSLVKAIADLHGAEVHLEDGWPGLRVVVSFGPA